MENHENTAILVEDESLIEFVSHIHPHISEKLELMWGHERVRDLF